MGRWTSDPVLLETADVINTAVNEGEGCFSPDGNTLYFSRCMDLDKKRRQACDIYVTTKNIPAQDGKKSKKKSKKTEDDGNAASNSSSEWTEPVRLNLGDSAYNFLHPAISSDGLTLYFSSDMPHENDGDNVLDFDIWRVSRHSVADDFGKAFNMGRVLNSEGDETFPILRNDTTLYYSSTGLPGVGGSDIFVTTLRGNRCSDPVNLGVPINSSYDEHSLFAADGFGKFGALANETDDWACEARRYYFNICGKYGMQVQNVLKKAATLDIRTICPLHGPILTGDLTPYLQLYQTWSTYTPESEGVLVAYASIHGGTAEAAKELGRILQEKGAKKVVVSDLCREDLAEVIEDAFRYPCLVCAASTYDAGIFPPMHDFIHHLQIKNYQKRRIALVENGSWAPVAGKAMRQMFEGMKEIDIVEPMVTIRSRMKPTDIPQLEALADAILA